MKTLKKTVYISKFVETEGVFALEVEYDPTEPGTVHNPRQGRTFVAPDWHETRDEAVEQGRSVLNRMLKQIHERRARLEQRLASLATTTD